MQKEYENLANAIVQQAVKDYRKALLYLHRHPDCSAYRENVCELENFFRSEWIHMLTDLDGTWIMDKVRKAVKWEVLA